MKKILLYIVLFTSLFTVAAQKQDIYKKYDIYRNPFRVILNKFSWTVTTGYGLTNYRHDLDGYIYFQDAFNQFIAPSTSEAGPVTTLTGYTNWLNNPAEGGVVNLLDPNDVPFDRLQSPVNNPALQSSQFLVNTDTAAFGFAGAMNSVPIQLSVHYDYEKFRLGLGWSYEQQWLRQMKPTAFEDQAFNYVPNEQATSFTRLFGVLGYEFYEFWWHSFVGEVQIGRVSYGNAFPTVDQGIFVNLGVSIEQNLSEYFRVIVRPSYDIKNYTINIPDGGSINHRHNTFFVQVGISINIPEIPRSPMKSDHVQLKHVITDPETGRLMEVRGQPIWKRQNPKVGENHRRLWRYKLRNRRKMHPY